MMIDFTARATEPFTRCAMLQTEAMVFVVDDDVSVRESLAALV